MTNEMLLDAIGAINDEAVQEAKAYRRAKPRIWLKWGAVAACLCLAVAAVALLPYADWRNHRSEDPDWAKTHFQTAELHEIEAICGTDLLLDKIALPGTYHSEYILEIAEGGDFDSDGDWRDLSVHISCGKNANDEGADNIFCFIVFHGDTEDINLFLWESETTIERNGYIVECNEKTTVDYEAEGITLSSKLDYHGSAVFAHNGYTYFLFTNSDDADFYDAVLDQMLGAA